MSGATGVTWELTSGLGNLSSLNTLATTYTPSPIAGTAFTRQDMLKVTADDLGGCTPDVITFTVEVRKAPSLSLIQDEVICGSQNNLSVELKTTLSGPSSSIEWRVVNLGTSFTAGDPDYSQNGNDYFLDYNPDNLNPNTVGRLSLIHI